MAVLFTVLLGLSALLLAYFLHDFGKQNFLRETEAAINSEMEHVLSRLNGLDEQEVTNYIDGLAAQHNHPIYLYIDMKGKVLAGSYDRLPSQVDRVKEGVIAFDVRLGGRDVRVASKIHTFDNGSRLLIARDIQDITASYKKLKWISKLIMGFMLLVVLVSFFLSVFVVRRINVIAETAKHIMETDDLSKRISIEGNWDDLSNLAQTLNTLLARVESLMQGVRDVSDSIAHDLRTPLTRLRSHLEEARDKDISPEDIDRFMSEADHMLHTFNALLRIANIEKGKRHQAFEPVDLKSLLQDVIELYEPLADEKDIVLDQQLQDAPLRAGDRDLLFQLFANLFDNAIKFSPEKSAVSIGLKHKKGQFIVTITDQGEGIAAVERDKVFDRFYRVDKSRHTSGSGLGLSLVKAIVEQHAGTIILTDNQPGLCVTITL